VDWKPYPQTSLREGTARGSVLLTTRPAPARRKWVLKRLLGGRRPEINEVAKELGMSSRTLQRRITDEGTNYRQLLNDARDELARFYLKEPSLSVSEIAYLLSYEDPSSFFRAFHEREGMTPNEWKAMHRKRNAASVIR
jgi:AraC-like DNA-binding protein